MLVLQGLRLLPIVVPQGFDVAPVATLLNGTDAKLREKARESLTLTATDNACDALIDAAAKADAPFATALLDAVATLRNLKSLDLGVGVVVAQRCRRACCGGARGGVERRCEVRRAA